MRSKLLMAGIALTVIAATLLCPEEAMALGGQVGEMLGKEEAKKTVSSVVSVIKTTSGIGAVLGGIATVVKQKLWAQGISMLVIGSLSYLMFKWVGAEGLMIL